MPLSVLLIITSVIGKKKKKKVSTLKILICLLGAFVCSLGVVFFLFLCLLFLSVRFLALFLSFSVSSVCPTILGILFLLTTAF